MTVLRGCRSRIGWRFRQPKFDTHRVHQFLDMLDELFLDAPAIFVIFAHVGIAVLIEKTDEMCLFFRCHATLSPL